jgi:hypothetical protein
MKKLAFLFLSTLSVAQSVTKSIALLPDTGQTNSYTTTFGEDHDYSINPPSFTNNGNGTITDNVTGLMWQQADDGEMIYENAAPFCEALSYAGNTDWRLPSPMESFSILNLQNNNPSLNTTYFTTSTAEYWWTNKAQVGDNTKVWCTNAGGGIGNKPKAETISAGGTFKYHTRCVRDLATPMIIPNHFTDNGNGTITDNLTQLVWQKVPNPNIFSWEQAIAYAEGLSFANFTDWRLPNIKELQSLNDESVSNPSVNSAFFGSLGVHNYWSSTTLKPNTANPASAWYWSTQLGITTYDLKTNSNYVVCVRGIPTLNADEFLVENNIKIYPNPASNFINLYFPKKLNIVQIDITDTLGKIVYSKTVKSSLNEYKIDSKDFTDGLYYVSISTENSNNTLKVLIKK